MHIDNIGWRSTVAGLAIAVAACGPSADARRKADSAVAAAQARTATQAATQAGEVLSTRREAQVQFDSARASFLMKDRTSTAKALKEAAVFTRAQADSATGAARTSLNNSAAELDRIAAQVGRNRVASVKTLDYAFARTQLAEAQFHRDHALAALRASKNAAVGAELMMATDHFERALADAGQAADESAKTVIAGARGMATRLASGAPVVAADVESMLTNLGKEVERVKTTVAKLKA